MTKLFLLFLTACFLCSCATYSAEQPQPAQQSEPSLFEYSYKGCELLLQRAMAPLDRNRDILVASFVNADKLEESSTFGRAIADNYITYLVTQGYKISEIKLRDNLLVKQDAGEFMLSRNLKTILLNHNVYAVVAGTYSVGANNVYVTAKIINPVDGVIIASVDYKVPMTRDVKKMLGIAG
jgi:TolB-like protein